MNNQRRGYTILEMLISISIIIVMIGVVVAVYSFGKPFDTIKGDTDKLVAVIANIRNRAFNNAQFFMTQTKCSLDLTTNCSTNADCTAANKGHCTNLRYPPLGYGVHITVDSTNKLTSYKIFADVSNPDGTLPYYDGYAERLESATSTAKFVLGTGGATEIEAIFNQGALALHQKIAGLWSTYNFSGAEEYLIKIQDFAGIGCVKNQQGLVTLNGISMRVSGAMTSCP